MTSLVCKERKIDEGFSQLARLVGGETNGLPSERWVTVVELGKFLIFVKPELPAWIPHHSQMLRGRFWDFRSHQPARIHQYGNQLYQGCIGELGLLRLAFFVCYSHDHNITPLIIVHGYASLASSSPSAAAGEPTPVQMR